MDTTEALGIVKNWGADYGYGAGRMLELLTAMCDTRDADPDALTFREHTALRIVMAGFRALLAPVAPEPVRA